MERIFCSFTAYLFIIIISMGGISPISHAKEINKKTTSEVKVANTELDNIKKTLNQMVDAVNQKNSTKLTELLTQDFTLITLENKKITPLPAFLDYFNGLFKGKTAPVKNLILDIQPDPEPIYLDAKIAIIQGTANEQFFYYKGDDQVLHTRWTMVLEKNKTSQSEWQISAIHHSSGITQSMLASLQSQMLKTALGGLVVGLVLGMMFISLSRKAKR